MKYWFQNDKQGFNNSLIEVCLNGIFPYIFFVFCLLAISDYAYGLTSLKLGESSGSSGSGFSVPIFFESNDGIAAVQVDIFYDPAIVAVGFLEKKTGAVNHSLNFQNIGNDNNLLRVVLHSDDLFSLRVGVLMEIPITLLDNVAESSRSLSLGGVVFSDIKGKNISAQLLPTVRLSNPGQGDIISATVESALTGVSFDTDGAITQVKFFANNETIGLSTQAPYTVVWQPAFVGKAIIMAVATDNNGIEAESEPIQVNVGIPGPYPDWHKDYFTEVERGTPSISGLLADPDNDGIPNLLEYAFYLHPRFHDREGFQFIEKYEEGGKNYLSITYQRPIEQYTPDINIKVGVTSDLKTWNYGNQFTKETETITEGIIKTVTVRDLTAIEDIKTRAMRVKIESD